MSAEGSRRNAGMTLTTTQRTAGMSAACHDELPQLKSSAAAEIGANQPPKALRATKAENRAHRMGSYRDFQTSTLPSVPPARDDLSSLSCVSFSKLAENNRRHRYRHINEPQNMSILSKMALETRHRPAAQRRASTVTGARSERKLSGSRARARLCHSSPRSTEDRRRETLAMLCSLLC